jgi:hypothetical protein
MDWLLPSDKDQINSYRQSPMVEVRLGEHMRQLIKLRQLCLIENTSISVQGIYDQQPAKQSHNNQSKIIG